MYYWQRYADVLYWIAAFLAIIKSGSCVRPVCGDHVYQSARLIDNNSALLMSASQLIRMWASLVQLPSCYYGSHSGLPFILFSPLSPSLLFLALRASRSLSLSSRAVHFANSSLRCESRRDFTLFAHSFSLSLSLSLYFLSFLFNWKNALKTTKATSNFPFDEEQSDT